MALKPANGGTGGERDQRLDRLYGDTPRDTPPPHLDAAILAAARREVGARPRSLSALRRWRVPVSIAAVVVLSVSLVTLVREEGGDTPLQGEKVPAPAAPPPARTVEPPAPPAEERRLLEDRQRVAPPSDLLAMRPDQGAAKAKGDPAEGKRDARPVLGPAAAPESATVARPEAAVGLAAPRLEESSPRPFADQARPQAPLAAQRSAPESAVASAPAAARKMQAEALAMKPPPVWAGLEQEPPQKWLERAAELKRQGRTVEADELIAEFKRRFHDSRIPPELESR